jgi:hypothetical protein
MEKRRGEVGSEVFRFGLNELFYMFCFFGYILTNQRPHPSGKDLGTQHGGHVHTILCKMDKEREKTGGIMAN